MQKISQSKTIILPITKIGKNFLPYIKELETHKIKYIDISSSLVIDQNNQLVETMFSSGFFLSLTDRLGTIIYDNISLPFFNPIYNLGERLLIDKHISLQNSYIFNALIPESLGVGKYITLTFYWEEEVYSVYNKKNKTYKETIELLLRPSSNVQRVEKIKFPDIRTIAGKRIRSIRPAYEECTITPLGYKSINIDKENYRMIDYSIYLTLANGNYILIDHLNILLLKDIACIDSITFNDLLINFPDSYVEVYIDYKSEDSIPTEIRSIPLIIEYMED